MLTWDLDDLDHRAALSLLAEVGSRAGAVALAAYTSEREHPPTL